MKVTMSQDLYPPLCSAADWFRDIRLESLYFCLHGVIDITESDSEVSLTSRSQAPWCHWHHGVWLRGVIDITESGSMVSLTSRSLAQRCHWHHGVWLSGVIDITESGSAVSLTSRSLAQRCHWHRRVWLSDVKKLQGFSRMRIFPRTWNSNNTLEE